MTKNILTAMLAVMILSTSAISASATVAKKDPATAAIRKECMKAHPKQHQAYLSCVKEKHAEKGKTASTGKQASTAAAEQAPASIEPAAGSAAPAPAPTPASAMTPAAVTK